MTWVKLYKLMKIQAAKVQSFIANPDKNISAVLIYGPDSGQVSLLAKQLALKITPNLDDPFSVSTLDISRVEDDEAIIADEMSAISFGGGKKLVQLHHADNSAASSIKNAFEVLSPDAFANSFLLVTGGDLPATSALRKLFEFHPQMAALPCYADDETQLEKIVINELRAAQITFDNDVPELIASACQGNRLSAVNEVKKIKLFLGEQKHISFEDAENLVGVTSETSIQEICDLVLEGQTAKLQSVLQKAFEENNIPIVLIRSMQRTFEKINNVVSEVLSNGKNEQEVISSLRPPVFFKHVPIFKRQVIRWRAKGEQAFLKAYNMLYDAECECKKQGVNQELIVSHYFSKISQI
jgi:DNA polymerase-3 subunit delta